MSLDYFSNHLDQNSEEFVDPINYAEQAIARADLEIALRFADLEMQKVIRYLAEGKEIADVARLLGKKPQTIHNRWRRFQKHLRAVWSVPPKHLR